MVQFTYESRFPHSPQAVFAFHERDDVFELLLPPGQKVRVISRSGGLEAGARVVFRLYLGPFFLTWIAVHTEFERHRLFTDEQVKGPFRFWRHRHLFIPDGDGCRLRDEIAWSLPLERLLRPFVELSLQKMFSHRHAVTARVLAQESGLALQQFS